MIDHLMTTVLAESSDGLAQWQSVVESFRSYMDAQGPRLLIALGVGAAFLVVLADVYVARRLAGKGGRTKRKSA